MGSPRLALVLEDKRVGRSAIAVRPQQGSFEVIGTDRTRRPLFPAWPPLVVYFEWTVEHWPPPGWSVEHDPWQLSPALQAHAELPLLFYGKSLGPTTIRGFRRS